MQINLKEGRSRVLLSNVIFPQNNYTIYYKSEYKGSSSDQVYGNMEGEEYKKLDSTGILLSQGLWEIKAVFKEQENDEPNTYKPSNDDPAYLNIKAVSTRKGSKTLKSFKIDKIML